MLLTDKQTNADETVLPVGGVDERIEAFHRLMTFALL